MNREPFLAWKDDVQKLVQSFFDTDEHLISYVHNIIQIFQQGCYLQSLNKCVLPPNVSAHVKNLGLSVLDWWGIQLSGKRLIVKMNQLQNVGYTQKILIRDLFSGMFLPHEIHFIRVTGFVGFNYSKFKCQMDLFDDLVNMYIDIFKYIKTNQLKKKFWYDYRRHGISHTANMAIYLVSKAITCIFNDEYHSPEYSSYTSRFETFHDFPIQCVEYRSKLSNAGFFYFGYLDYVQCFCCGGCMRTWALNRNPFTRHSSLFPLCTHIRKILLNKIFETNDDRKEGDTYKKDDQATEKRLTSQTDYNKNFREVEKRFTTLQILKQTSDRSDLSDSMLRRYAETGFYHYGLKEDILCFSCNLGLTEISIEVNPWEIHWNLSPECPHLQRCPEMLKGIVKSPPDIESEHFIEYEFKER